MNRSQKMLIKDPYLNTSYKSDIPHYINNIPNKYYPQTQNISNQQWKISNDIYQELQQREKDYRIMERAYNQQNMLNKKILDYQIANNQYHQGLKLRNLDLNNQINDISTQKYLMGNKMQQDLIKNYHQKDLLLRKYQDQNQQLIQAKRTINNLIQLKSKLESEIQFLHFQLEKQNDKYNLIVKQQMIKMEGVQRSMKNLMESKDQQIAQLRHRIRVYQDENKRLNDDNRSLQMVNASQRSRQKDIKLGGIDNISQIQPLDSQSKQLKDQDQRNINNKLNQQKNINNQLQKQIDQLKKKLFSKDGLDGEDHQQENDQNLKSYQRKFGGNKNELRKDKNQNIFQRKFGDNNTDIIKQNDRLFQNNKLQNFNPQNLINSLITLRSGITKQIFQIFYKSVKDGQKNRSNSLVIFIQNWKQIDLDRIQPYIISYFQMRDTLQEVCLSNKYIGKPINDRIQQSIPLRVSMRKGRNEINTWILSTLQFTKNQRESGKKSMNNLLLFLFRLLTIYYRINYPMQGKSYVVDTDVRNQLQHQIVKAVNYIVEFR